jgi:hypothetical protein
MEGKSKKVKGKSEEQAGTGLGLHFCLFTLTFLLL